jgi:hypothetical protein
MQHIPFRDKELYLRVYVSVCVYGIVSFFPVLSHSSVSSEYHSSSRHHSELVCTANGIGKVLRNNGTRGPSLDGRGSGKIAPRLRAEIWSGLSKRGGGVSTLPPPQSLDGRAGHPGMTEAHHLGKDVHNHSHEAFA